MADQTFWIIAATPTSTTQGSNGVSRYDPRAHISALDSWVGSPVDLNHASVKKAGTNEARYVGEVVDAKWDIAGLKLKLKVEDPKIQTMIDQDLHEGFSVGVRATSREGETVFGYNPDHLAVILPPSEPRCPKDQCDVIEEPDSSDNMLLYSQPTKESLDDVPEEFEFANIMQHFPELSNDLELILLRELVQGKRFSQEAVYNAFEKLTSGMLELFSANANRNERDGSDDAEVASSVDENNEMNTKQGVTMTENGDTCNCKNEIATQEAELASQLKEANETVDKTKIEIASLQEQNQELEQKLESLSKVVDEYQSKEREALIEKLPDVEGLDYENKSLEELRNLYDFASLSRKKTAGAEPAGTEKESVETASKQQEKLSEIRQKLRKMTQ